MLMIASSEGWTGLVIWLIDTPGWTQKMMILKSIIISHLFNLYDIRLRQSQVLPKLSRCVVTHRKEIKI